MAVTQRSAWMLFTIGLAGSLAGAGLTGIASSQGTQSVKSPQPRIETIDPTAVVPVDTPGPSFKAQAVQSGLTVQAAGPIIGAGGCYQSVSGSGTHLIQSIAVSDAITEWRTNAAALYPVNNWNHAQAKAQHCERESPAHFRRRWICTVSGEPCIPGGTSTTTPSPPACYPSLSATGGDAKFQSNAEDNARNQWQHDAGDAYGVDYKYWGTAHGRDMSCHHNGLGPLQRRWTCTATAEPCR